MDLKQIKKHWDTSAKTYHLRQNVTPTTRDPFLGDLERNNILDYLRPHWTCLEIGCGDGLHSIQYAKKVKKIVALDIAQGLIDNLKVRVRKNRVANVAPVVGSVLDISQLFKDSRFDCVISQRCLINLPTWRHQKKALTDISRVLKERGLLLMSEGFQEPLIKLNNLREKFLLPEIKVVSYNHNIHHQKFFKFIVKHFGIVDKRDYGLYLLLSRIFHPLFVFPKIPKHNSKLNHVAKQLAEGLDLKNAAEMYSYNLFYALKRKS
jgi:ubiquinone/menaquinone biosynthesis C-methylase UbiE